MEQLQEPMGLGMMIGGQKEAEMSDAKLQNHVVALWNSAAATTGAGGGQQNAFDVYDGGLTKFYTAVHTDKELMVVTVKSIVEEFISGFKPFVSALFEVVYSTDYKFRYRIRSSRPSPTQYGTEKVVGRHRGLTSYEVEGHTDYYIDAVQVDWYFLQQPGGVKELDFKARGAVADIERTLLHQAIQTLTRHPKYRSDPENRAQGVAFADTVAKVMENRATWYNCLAGRDGYALELLIQRFNAMFSPNAGPKSQVTRVMIMKNRLLLEALARNPLVFSYSARGSDARKQGRLWQYSGNYGGIVMSTVPHVMSPNSNRAANESALTHRLTTGSTFCFTNEGIGQVPPDKYNSDMISVKAADINTNGWAKYDIIEAARSSIIFTADGKLDSNILMRLGSSMDEPETNINLWNITRVRDTVHNRRTANIFLKYVKKGDGSDTGSKKMKYEAGSEYQFVVPDKIGSLSSLVLSDNHLNYIYECALARFVECMTAADRELIDSFEAPSYFKVSKDEKAVILRKKIERISAELGVKPFGDTENAEDGLIEAGTNDAKGNYHLRSDATELMGVLKHIVARAVLDAPLEIATFEKWYRNNIPLPFVGRVTRPWELFEALDLWAGNGQKLGVMHWNGIGVWDPQVDTRTKDILINFDTDAGFGVLHPENNETIMHVLITRCISGHTNLFVDQRNFHKLIVEEQRQTYVAKTNRSCFFTFMALADGCGETTETLRKVVSMNGVYRVEHFVTEMKNSKDFEIQPTWNFSGQAILSSSGMFVDRGAIKISSKPSDDELAASHLYNGYCSLVETIKYCPMYGTKSQKGCHVLGPTINNFADRVLGRLTTEEIRAQDDAFYKTQASQPVLSRYLNKQLKY